MADTNAAPAVNSVIALGRRLRSTGRKMQVRVEARFDAADLSHSQWTALDCVRSCGGGDACRLAEELDVSTASVARLVEGLVARGLVCWQSDCANPRTRALGLTRAGEAKLREVAPVVEGRHAQLLAGLSEGEVATLLDLLDRLDASLDRKGG